MVKILQREEWVAEIEKVRPLMMNEELVVVNVLCDYSHSIPQYFLFQKKDRTVFSFIALTKDSEIKAPFHFFYSPFWANPNLTDTQYCQYLDEFLVELLNRYKKIEIKLPVGITDIRPFLWRNFSVVNYYTYVKQLDSLDYHHVTEKNIRKARNAGYECKQETLDKTSLSLNLKLFVDLKVYSSSKIQAIGSLLDTMSARGNLTCFNCYKNNELVASNLIFLDKKNKKAYTVLLNKISRANKDDVHSLLHDFFFTSLSNNGYEYVDLLGGDMPGIAPFKSRFNTKLEPHFLARYSKRKALFEDAVNKTKNAIKQVLAKI